MLAARGIDYNELNRSQALVPDACTVLFNAHGTAPGMWFERAGNVGSSRCRACRLEMEHLDGGRGDALPEDLPRCGRSSTTAR